MLAAGVFAGGTSNARAQDCPGNPDALGVSRVITVSARDYPRLGHMQYQRSLPLNDHEVVLTFDDGPLPPYTNRVLDILARDCLKATFFLVGRHAAAHPETARLVRAAGHTIGNHSQNHSLHFNAIGERRAELELQAGFRSLRTALADDGAVAPFFRVPGLNRTNAFEKFAQSQSVVVWSADTLADDWRRISSEQVLHRALSRLEAKRKGILLLHDIQPRTVLALPALLAELKRRGFRIVHVVPEGDTPPSAPAPVLVASAEPAQTGWPRTLPVTDGLAVTGSVATTASVQTTPPIVADEAPVPRRHAKAHRKSRMHRKLAVREKPGSAVQLAGFDRFRTMPQ